MSLRKILKSLLNKHLNYALVGLALASPFIFVDRVKAQEYIEGSVGVGCSLDGVGGAGANVGFVNGASYGLDEFDNLLEGVPSMVDTYVQVIGSVDGRLVTDIANPPIPKVVGSSGGASFSCSFVVVTGKTIELYNAPYSFSASGSIEGCKVYVNGVDLSESTDIPGGEITGTFGPGEHSIGSIDISVEYIGPGGNGGGDDGDDDGNGGEPNTPLDAGPHILRIDNNVLNSFLDNSFEFVLTKDAKDEIDAKDVEHSWTTGIPPPVIVSKVGDKYLTRDSRPVDNNSPVYLEQAVLFDSPVSTWYWPNALVFSFPTDGTNNKFGNRILTFQEYIPDANEPNAPITDPNAPKSFPDPNAETFPLYLISGAKGLIADGNGFGTVLLPDFPRRVNPGALHYFVLRTDALSKELAIGDFNKDGMVDVNDCNALETAMGHTGNCVYDIASADPNLKDPNDPNSPLLYIGIRPDEIVDESDKRAIYKLKDLDEKRREQLATREETGDTTDRP